MRDLVKNSVLTKMIALMTCVSFLSMIMNGCGGPVYANDEPVYRESTTYQQPPSPQYQRAPAVPQSTVVNMADQGVMRDFNECRYRMRVPFEQVVRMTSGRLCRNRNGVNRLVAASTDRSLTLSPGSRLEARDRLDLHMGDTHVHNRIEFFGQGLEWYESLALILGSAALLSLAISLPLMADAGWFSSGRTGPEEIVILSSPLISF